MVQQLIDRWQHDAAGSPRVLGIALGVALLGLVLWTAGARVSRSFFTLVGVSLGAWLGLHVPRWLGWEIDTMGTAIGGALVLGLAGYLMHAAWLGLTLGTLLSTAGAFVAWHRLSVSGVTFTLPSLDPTQSPTDFVRQLWQGVPHVIPIVAGAAGIIGGLIAGFLPKLGRVLTFSLLGTLLLVVGGGAAVMLARPQWLEQLPASTQTRGIVLAAVIALGAVIQWASSPRAPRRASLDVAPSSNPTKPQAAGPRGPRGPRDVRDLGSVSAGPFRLKGARP